MKESNYKLDSVDEEDFLTNIINSQLSFLNDKFSVIDSINENTDNKNNEVSEQ